jgi:antitoxin VapB
MSLNIKNEHVHDLAREAARRTGMSQTSVVEQALTRLLADLNANQTGGRRGEVDRIVADFHARWVEAGKPPLTTDHLYDDRGLPA